MGVLMIQCPVDRPRSVDRHRDDRCRAASGGEGDDSCPACGRVHEWTKHEAWLADGGRQYRVLVIAH